MIAVVVPVKSFDLAKGRLADAIGPEERAQLAEQMATGVLRAAKDLPKWVVCGDQAVSAWALGHGAGVIWREPTGLNNAVTAGVQWCRSEGHQRVIIAHGDLPLASDLTWLGSRSEDVVIVTDRRQDGSNVVMVPTDSGFQFQYGADSAAKHATEADRLGLSCVILEDEQLGWDVDVPEDLQGLSQ